VIPALLSRSQVYVLNSFGQEELKMLLERAYAEDSWVKEQGVELEDPNILYRLSGGDGRKLLNTLELLLSNAEGKSRLSTEEVQEIVQQNLSVYDKSGEMHYDLISAFIKSVRGSDPDASMYYLCRMTASGEDPKFIARRLFILASEDIGLANPTALALAASCFDAVQALGYPECEIPLAECTIYLASSPKSNSAYLALKKAQALVKEYPNEAVPLFLRNAPTKLMKELGYGADYKYPHDYPGAFVKQNYLPDSLKNQVFYKPKDLGREKALKEYLERLKE
jgi:putative ATPase